jgi:hypothetical protein
MSEPLDPLNRYATRKTTPAEERQLLRNAIDSQEAFDDLVEEELFRELLDDPKTKAILLKAAKPVPAWQESLQAFFQSKLTWSVAGVAAVAALVAIVIPHQQPDITKGLQPATITVDRKLSAMDSLPSDLGAAFEAYTTSTRPNDSALKLSLNRKEFNPGDPLRVTFHCDIEAKLIVVESSAGSARILFPNSWTTDARITAGLDQATPPADRPALEVDGAPRTLRFIAVAYPADSDPVSAIQRGEPLPQPLAATSVEAVVK